MGIMTSAIPFASMRYHNIIGPSAYFVCWISSILISTISILTLNSNPSVTYTYLGLLERLWGAELFDHIAEIGPYSENVAKQYISQIIDGIEFMHSMDIAHRDIKPENILLASADENITDIRIIDVGLAKSMKESSHTDCGTLLYSAPEVHKHRSYDVSIDIWSLGCVIFMIVGGYHPFDPFAEKSDPEIVQSITSGDYSFVDEVDDIWSSRSSECKDLISRCLSLDPSKRLTAKEMKDHPWFSNMGHSEHLSFLEGQTLGDYQKKMKKVRNEFVYIIT
eukprot:g3451.t1